MAEALVKVLSQSLTSLIQDEFGVLWGVKKDQQKLKQTLKRINVILEAADGQQFSNKELKNWLEDLIEVAYEAEDVVDEFATTKAQQSRASGIFNKQVCKFLPSPLCFRNIRFRHKIGHKLKAAIKRLDENMAARPNIPSKEGHPNRGSEVFWRETNSFVIESEVFGREEDREKIVELLVTCVNSQKNLSIIPIVGMGGIGKTTLAQLVYNDTRVKDHFELTIWVYVSEDFDHKRLIRAIIESATKKSCDLVNANPLQDVLREKLNGKKFLLVLDDVWNDNENEWERLKNLLTYGGNGSSVIVTTRSPIVAKIMGTVSEGYDLTFLSMDDCWSLFKKRAFGDGRREENPKLVEIGKEIVKKCGGVPLAAKTLGSLMRFKSTENEWLSIKESELWQSLLEDQDHILPALRLSYIHLPQRLRQCFVFCSLFPKDYEMEKEELIHMWVANGLVQPKSERGELEESHDIFNELIGRSFFQDIEKDKFGDIRTCKIHDLMHDLAKKVSKDECCSIDSKEAADKVRERTKHLNVNFGSLLSTPTKSLCVAKRLRSLIFYHDWHSLELSEEETEFARYILLFKFLRVLCLSGGSTRKIPSCIGSLKHLRYLNFSSTSIESLPKSIGNLLNLQILKLRDCKHLKMLPESIGNLLNLQILELSYCCNLEELPESISNLGSLHILDLWHCFKLGKLPTELRKMRSLKHLNNEGTGLTHMPTGIGHLRDLQTLPRFVVGENEGSLIKELRELDRIKGELFIEGLSNVACARDAIDADLRRKPNLETLGLFWQQRDGEENIDSLGLSWQQLDGEEKQRDEEVLEGLQPQSNLKELSIHGNKGFRFPHWLQASSLPNLVKLKLLNCRNFEKLSSFGQLPSLKSLHIKGLYSVKYIDNELYGSCERRGFPSLEILWLEDMQNLEVISVEEGREHFPTLKQLCLVDMPKLKILSVVEGREHFHRLRELRIIRCHKLMGIPHFPFPSEVILRGCQEQLLLPEGLLKKSTHLKSLKIEALEKLVSFGEHVDNLVALKSLEIRECAKMVSLPQGLKYLKSLEKLYISGCESLLSLPEGLTSLKYLSIENCDNLSSLSGGFNTSGSYALEYLIIRNCLELTSLPEGIHHLNAIQCLGIFKCENLTSLPQGILHLTALEYIKLKDCPTLTSLPEGIHHLTALTYLEILECKQLSSLPDWIQDCTSLQYLRIRGCGEELVTRYEKERGADWHKIAHIPHVQIE